MKLEKWASIAEIVSGVAVVVTLVYLILGIRDNTEITRAAMFAGSIESINALERSIMEDPELSQIYSAYIKGETNHLTEIEDDRLNLILANLFRSYDTAFSMQSYDLFGENEWARFQNAICGNYYLVVDTGHEERVSILLTPDFVSFIRTSCNE